MENVFVLDKKTILLLLLTLVSTAAFKSKTQSALYFDRKQLQCSEHKGMYK